ncbi:MAG: hypothetical protein ABJA74_16310 [Lapillicoccus sp.]
MALFQLNTVVLTLLLFGVIIGATLAGHLIGRSVRHNSEGLREPFGVIQAAMLGFMALVLAFGLSLAVGRYENRRVAVVNEANALSAAYLRAQTLSEPNRTRSLELLRQLTDTSIAIAQTVPGSPEQNEAIARSGQTQRALWAQAGQAVISEPTATASRLYLESLNDAFDSHSSRVFGLGDRVPWEILVLEIVGSAIALALLALHLGTLGRGPAIALLAAVLVAGTLFITFDLDRPVRGLISVSADPLTQLRSSMADPPAFGGAT